MDEAKQSAESNNPAGIKAMPLKLKDSIMKTLTIFASIALLSTGALFAGMAHADASYDQYRRVVLGDTTIATPVSPNSITRTELVSGPQGQYLMSIGTNKADAIAAAARNGEQATYRTVRVEKAPRQLTQAEAYARYLGNDSLTVQKNEAVGSAE